MVEMMLWDIWQESWARNSCAVHLLLWLVTHANTEDKEQQGLVVKRGQLLASIRGLSKQTGISEQSVRTALRQLCLTRHITQQATHSNTIITICNYDSYMTKNFHPNTPSNTAVNTPNTEENKAILADTKKLQHVPVKTKINRRSSIFTKPTLDECMSYASEKSYHWDVGRFFDYYEACGWKVGNKPMKDWKAAMRNWNRRESEQYGNTSLSIAGKDENNRYGITFSGNTCEQKSKESLFKIIRRLDQE